jgi:hypothetical protein
LKTLRIIGLVDRDDPITEMIARTIVEIAQTGVHDPAQLSAMAIKEIGIPKTASAFADHKFVPYRIANQISISGTSVHFLP